MLTLHRISLTIFLIIISVLFSVAQTKSGGSISGKITRDGKPANGIAVTVGKDQYPLLVPPEKTIGSSVTDNEGNYYLTGLPAGNYVVTPYDPANYLPVGRQSNFPGKGVTLNSDETVKGIDFDIARGAVITGKITDADGKPVVETQVKLSPLDKNQILNSPVSSFQTYRTDDRGVYRIYGLPAGQYLVSVGEERNASYLSATNTTRKKFYPLTYYPGVTEKADAKGVELSEGTEATEIDIKMAPAEKTYAISGRVTDGTSGKGVAGVSLNYGTMSPDGKRIMDYVINSSVKSDSNGDYKLEGIKPGSYSVFISRSSIGQPQGPNRVGEPVNVEVTDNDLTGVDLKTQAGLSIDGIIQLEGKVDAAALANLGLARVYGSVVAGNGSVTSPLLGPNSTISSDGSFHLDGFSAGRVMLYINFPPQIKGFVFRRVELNGVALPNNMPDLSSGNSISGLVIVVAYGTGRISGQAVFPTGVSAGRTFLWLSKIGEPTLRYTGSLDARGHFVFEGLISGEYQVILTVSPPNGSAAQTLRGETNVTVTDGMESTVTVNLVPPKKEGQP